MEESYSIEELSEFAEEIIQRTGEEALSYYGKGKSKVKFDESLVTKADIRLNEFFRDRLYERFPEHQLFENGQGDREYSHEGKRFTGKLI